MSAPKRLWTPENVALLGTMPDTMLGQHLGIASASVCRARAARGIPPHRKPSAPKPPKPKAPPKPRGPRPAPLPDAVMQQLGTMSDQALAEATGASYTKIRQRRIAAGIAPFGSARPPGERVAVCELPEPTPQVVKAARLAAGHNQAQASALVRLRTTTDWSRYETGVNKMDLARWELYLLLTGQHPTLRVVPREPGGG